jgi:hypothetical protein
MEIDLEFEASDSVNAHFSVAVDGNTCGKLSMPTEKAARFAEIIQRGCEKESCPFHISGKVPVSQDWVLWHKRSGIERRDVEDRRTGIDRRRIKNRRSGKGQRKQD